MIIFIIHYTLFMVNIVLFLLTFALGLKLFISCGSNYKRYPTAILRLPNFFDWVNIDESVMSMPDGEFVRDEMIRMKFKEALRRF